MLSWLMRRWRLACRRRPRFSPADFRSTDGLYRDFSADDLDDEGVLDSNALRLPDLSCNWSRFSIPEDILHREGGSLSNGCFEVTVEIVRYKEFATPCHDPICEGIANYSHVEVRELREGEDVHAEPEKLRKKRRKSLRAEWRVHITHNLEVKLAPKS